jgi:hypothetical protein
VTLDGDVRVDVIDIHLFFNFPHLAPASVAVHHEALPTKAASAGHVTNLVRLVAVLAKTLV